MYTTNATELLLVGALCLAIGFVIRGWLEKLMPSLGNWLQLVLSILILVACAGGIIWGAYGDLTRKAPAQAPEIQQEPGQSPNPASALEQKPPQ